jgi:hypothetical protein
MDEAKSGSAGGWSGGNRRARLVHAMLQWHLGEAQRWGPIREKSNLGSVIIQISSVEEWVSIFTSPLSSLAFSSLVCLTCWKVILIGTLPGVVDI